MSIVRAVSEHASEPWISALPAARFPAAVVVVAKRPDPGRVKTRLSPPLSPVQAAHLAAAALRDTLRAVDDCPVQRRILAFDGDPDGWLRPGWELHQQSRGGLDARIVAALAGCGRAPAVLVGMDTPQLRVDDLTRFDPSRYDACLGPASDGGYWAIGLRDARRAADVIAGVPMSSAETGAEQLWRMTNAGMRVQVLDELTDVDTIEDGLEVAELAPNTEFAHAAAGVLPALDATAVP